MTTHQVRALLREGWKACAVSWVFDDSPGVVAHLHKGELLEQFERMDHIKAKGVLVQVAGPFPVPFNRGEHDRYLYMKLPV
jgi:hypothetical protein